MKTNRGAIILAERAADHGRIRAILREWGYRESEIQRVIKQQDLFPRAQPTAGKTCAAKSGDDVGAAAHQEPEKC